MRLINLLVLVVMLATGCVDQEIPVSSDGGAVLQLQSISRGEGVIQPTVFDWTGWGNACERPSYGLTTCTNDVSNVRGFCVQGLDVCMPSCQGNNYSCPDGSHQEYSEYSECYCAP